MAETAVNGNGTRPRDRNGRFIRAPVLRAASGPQRILIHRSDQAANLPTGLSVGELAVNMASTPPRLWVGVPAAIDASERLLLADGATVGRYLPLTGGTLSGALTTPVINVEHTLALFDRTEGAARLWYIAADERQLLITNAAGTDAVLGSGGLAVIDTAAAVGFRAFRVFGSLAAPQWPAANADIASVYFRSAIPSGPGIDPDITGYSGIIGYTSEDWDATAQGCGLRVVTTPNGSTVAIETARFNPDGTLTLAAAAPGTDNNNVATKWYVDQVSANYLPLTGGTLSGNLTVGGYLSLAQHPALDAHAATKWYVDQVSANFGNYLPLVGGTLTGSLTAPVVYVEHTLAVFDRTEGAAQPWFIAADARELLITNAAGSTAAVLTSGGLAIIDNGVAPGFRGFRVFGSIAAPQWPPANVDTASIYFRTTIPSGPGIDPDITGYSGILGYTSEAWDATAQGCGVRIVTTPNGSIVAIETARFNPDGTLTLAAAAPGANGNNAATKWYVDNRPFLPLTGGILTGTLTANAGVYVAGDQLWVSNALVASTAGGVQVHNGLTVYGGADLVSLVDNYLSFTGTAGNWLVGPQAGASRFLVWNSDYGTGLMINNDGRLTLMAHPVADMDAVTKLYLEQALMSRSSGVSAAGEPAMIQNLVDEVAQLRARLAALEGGADAR